MIYIKLNVFNVYDLVIIEKCLHGLSQPHNQDNKHFHNNQVSPSPFVPLVPPPDPQTTTALLSRVLCNSMYFSMLGFFPQHN